MGVRESVEQGGSDETRLHDLVIREKNPEKELPFGPEKDITKEQWEKMLDFLPSYQAATQSRGSMDGWVATPGEFYSYLMLLKTLSPERVEKFVQEHNDTLGKVDWQAAEKVWKGAEALEYLKKNFSVPEEMRDAAKDLAEGRIDPRTYYKKALAFGRQNDDYDFFAYSVMWMRLRGFERNEVELNDDDWTKIKHEFVQAGVDHNAVKMAKLAFAMKVLAAPGIRVTGAGGIEFVDEHASSFKEEKPELPVRKSF